MTAQEVKEALRVRYPAIHPAGGSYAWTCIEEWMNIDLLAWCAWSSWPKTPPYARIGHEVKISRSDYKRELLKPHKRVVAVAFCHEFYFVVPHGLLKPDEIAWTPPPGFPTQGNPFLPERCPGFYGAWCHDGQVTFGRGKVSPLGVWGDRLRLAHRVAWPSYRGYQGTCPTCRGTGTVAAAPAIRAAAPKLWVPPDVGLIVIDGGRCHVAKRAPRRKPDEQWSALNLAQLVRWVSVRPDPRHDALRRDSVRLPL